jgi:hypothetical protein
MATDGLGLARSMADEQGSEVEHFFPQGIQLGTQYGILGIEMERFGLEFFCVLFFALTAFDGCLTILFFLSEVIVAMGRSGR